MTDTYVRYLIFRGLRGHFSGWTENTSFESRAPSPGERDLFKKGKRADWKWSRWITSDLQAPGGLSFPGVY